MLEMTNAAALIDLSEEAKRAIEVLSETMNLVCYIYYADFQDLEELHESGARGRTSIINGLSTV